MHRSALPPALFRPGRIRLQWTVTGHGRTPGEFWLGAQLPREIRAELEAMEESCRAF